MTMPEGVDVHLTPREQEVLSAVCLGRTSKQIGLELGLRPHTVEAYIEHIRLKFGAANRCHMVALAVRHGLGSKPDQDADRDRVWTLGTDGEDGSR